MSNKTFFDANVLIEVIEKRKYSDLAVRDLIDSSEKYISSLTVHIVMHFESKAYDIKYLRNFFTEFHTLSLLSEDVGWAFANSRNDEFEDALQVAIAIRNGCNTFVTFDKKLAKDYANLPTLKIKLLS